MSILDAAIAKKIHATWKASGQVNAAMKRALIDLAVRNQWPVPAHAAGQAKLQGFNTRGLITK